MNGLDRETLLDGVEVLRDAARSFSRHPDCVPESWELGREWVREARDRASRLEALAAILEALAAISIESGGES